MKILIVDDERLVRLALTRAFKQSGHEVYEAESGIAALELWPKIDPDIVLLDVLMPNMNGPEVLQEIKPDKAMVIMMSAYKGEYDSIKVRNLGACDFFAKPFENIMDIVDKVEKIYEQKS